MALVKPVISPWCGVKGTRKLTGRKRGSTVSRGTTGSFVACQDREKKKEKTVGFMKLKDRRIVTIMHGATG